VKRAEILDRLRHPDGPWDMVVVGGGATGLGTAVDAASRGYRTLLLEQHDFAKGTSSRSTKLVHGGVRYLRQGNLSLVMEALRERGRLLANAPHLVRNQAFVVPNYRWWEPAFYGVGLTLYDRLAGRYGLGRSRLLSKAAVLERVPTLRGEGLKGGVQYQDGQFDDSRLAINLMQTVFDQGGLAVNYVAVTGLLKRSGRICGVVAEDGESRERFEIPAAVVVNATGVFTDAVRRLDEPGTAPLLQFSQGVHVVLDREFLPGESAMMIPQTEDGRVLFAIPWQGKVLLGTTDTPVAQPELEPRAFDGEVDFLLEHARKYLVRPPERGDVRSVFTGLRPLIRSDGSSTKRISREHALEVSEAGLVTITGGKWTTYRKMGQTAVDRAVRVAGLAPRPCVTAELRVHGCPGAGAPDNHDPLRHYGSDLPLLRRLVEEDPRLGEPLHPGLPYLRAEVIWAVRSEMAVTVEDVLSRRTRALLLDARASREIAPAVASLMAQEMGKGPEWIQAQVDSIEALATGYILN
jgi:glycerol-3-phosphate dehydrogenase